MCSSDSSRPGGGPSKIITAPTCMCEVSRSPARKDASIADSRSMCRWPAMKGESSRLYPHSAMPGAPEKLLLAAPRGYCAGVDRAVQTVERALELYGPPVYVRKEIVHNKHVVEQLRERGAVFVEDEGEVPEGQTVVFSAHGVAPTVHAGAEARELKTIDATCPLVTKVHVEA